MIHPPITTSSLHLRSFEPDQLLEVVHGARFEHYILGRTRCSARLARWSCGSFTVDVGNYNFPVRAVGEFSRFKLCVGYMRQLTQPSWVNGFTCDRGTMEFYPESSELNYRAAPNAEWIAVEFEREALQIAAREHLGHELDLPWKHAASFPVPRAVRAALDRMIRELWRHPVSGALMITPILGAIATILNEAGNRSAGSIARGLLKRQEMLVRVDGYLQANLADPFNLAALAAAAGATPRTLQREFINAYGMTPQGWARCLALHRVRRRLRGSDGKRLTVEAIARECGFRHMGRFAGYYFHLFGEYPSRTMRSTPEGP
jgi:AraC-like DNA-binding protein